MTTDVGLRLGAQLRIIAAATEKSQSPKKYCGPHTETKKSLVYFSNGMDFIESISQIFYHTEQAVFPIQKSIYPCPKQCVMVNHQQQIRYQT
jgi:hypothetical protein